VPASPADRGKQNALVTNLAVAIVERQASSAAIQMARERNLRGSSIGAIDASVDFDIDNDAQTACQSFG